jgi:hypothetical protein
MTGRPPAILQFSCRNGYLDSDRYAGLTMIKRSVAPKEGPSWNSTFTSPAQYPRQMNA